MNARELTLQLRGRWHGTYGCAPCPVCQADQRRDQNALTLGDGRRGLLLHCKKAGCDFRDILAAAGLRPGDYVKPDPVEMLQRKLQRDRINDQRSEAAKRVWAEAVPIIGTLGETYLRSRGIRCDLPDSLRFHARCYHGPTRAARPALVALVTSGDAFAIHRTFLRADGIGKAGLPDGDKMMLGRVRGGAVTLSDDPGRLIVCEGIETGLALLSGLLDEPATVRAALSASGIRTLRLPDQAGCIAIACDGDSEGREAAQALARRAHASGWRVSILDPGDGRDFNDILNRKAWAA